jgi:hypothetical protein
MIEWQMNAGYDNNILKAEFEKLTQSNDLPTIRTTYTTDTHLGFTGLVPPVSDEFNPDPSTVIIRIYTPADTPSAPGLAVATAQGWYDGGPNFPPVAVEVPYLAAGCEVAWAGQAVGGEREFRYRVTNTGTPPLTTLSLPAGRQHGVTTALAPAGWTANIGALATTFSGTLAHGQAVLVAMRSAQPTGDPLQATIGTGTETLWAAVGVPGASLPRPLASWTDATGFHARFLVRPGASVRASHSSDLSDWSDASDSFTMPYTTNVLQVNQAMSVSSFFLRLRRDVPAVVEVPELLALPAAGTWLDAGPAEPELPVGEPVTLPP